MEALTARLGQVTADNIDADQLSAAFASLIRAAAERLEAGEVQADSLSAALAELVSVRVRTLDVDYAHLRDLATDEAIITDGTAGTLRIDRLAVTSAMLLSAALGELVLKGADNRYYRLSVRADGTLATEVATVTEGEIQAGQTQQGQSIVETAADIASLDAQSLRAESGVIAGLFTEALTAGSITAGEVMLAGASVPELYATSLRALGETLDISANRSISMLVGALESASQSAEAAETQAQTLRRWMTFDEEGLHQGREDSPYSTLIDDVGFHVLRRGEKIGSFARRQLAVEDVRIGRVAERGPRCVLREAADGGMIITVEGVTP